MNRKRFFVFIILVLLIAYSNIIAQDTGVSFNYDELYYTVRTNKKVFGVGETIEIINIIQNEGSELIEIEVTDIPIVNFDYKLYTLKGKIIEKTSNFYEEKEKFVEKSIDPRKEEIYSNEQYGKVVSLNNYYEELSPGRYVLEPIFFPLTNIGDSYPEIVGKKIQIQIVPISFDKEVSELDEIEYEKRDEPLCAFDTVDYILESKLITDWEGFFAYMDLSEIIKLYDDWYDEYIKLPKSKRDEKLEIFKEYLISEFEPNMSGYEVIVSRETKNTAEVVAEIYRGEKQNFILNYTFDLEKRDELWILIRFEVVNQGRE